MSIFYKFLFTGFLAPEVVPLQALGVIDVGATHVGDNEMLAHALANMSSEALEAGYAVKHGGDFVNEYARTDADGERTDGGRVSGESFRNGKYAVRHVSRLKGRIFCETKKHLGH